MAAYTRESASARVHRQVNVAHLLVDSVLGLEEHQEDMAKAAQSSNCDLDTWAAGYKVRNTAMDDGHGAIQIALKKMERPGKTYGNIAAVVRTVGQKNILEQ